MVFGLNQEQGVELADHNPEWGKIAAHAVERLWRVFGSVAKDIQHIGSTAVKNIKAKPIIDIAVGVEVFDDIESLTPVMEQGGFIVEYAVKENEWHGFRVFADAEHSIRTYNIHVIKSNSAKWHEFICFRDYLNLNPHAARKYETLKLKIIEETSGKHSDYKENKHDFIQQVLKDAKT